MYQVYVSESIDIFKRQSLNKYKAIHKILLLPAHRHVLQKKMDDDSILLKLEKVFRIRKRNGKGHFLCQRVIAQMKISNRLMVFYQFINIFSWYIRHGY